MALTGGAKARVALDDGAVAGDDVLVVLLQGGRTPVPCLAVDAQPPQGMHATGDDGAGAARDAAGDVYEGLQVVCAWRGGGRVVGSKEGAGLFYS